MARATFSGPLRVGPKIDAPNANVGDVVLSQSFDSGDLTGTIVSNVDRQLGVLPAGARIIDIVVDQVVAATAGTTTVSVGTASGGAQLMGGVATTAGGRFLGAQNSAALQLAWQTPAMADTPIWVRVAVATATLTAGRFIVTVSYIQR